MKSKSQQSSTLIGIIFEKAEYPYGDEGVRDILTDLMHYCKRNDILFEQELILAANHFHEESK